MLWQKFCMTKNEHWILCLGPDPSQLLSCVSLWSLNYNQVMEDIMNIMKTHDCCWHLHSSADSPRPNTALLRSQSSQMKSFNSSSSFTFSLHCLITLLMEWPNVIGFYPQWFFVISFIFSVQYSSSPPDTRKKLCVMFLK